MTNASEPQVYTSPRQIFDDYGAWFAALCLRYQRRYSDRMINDLNCYAPAAPAMNELINELAKTNAQSSQDWLDHHEVPPLDKCNELLAVIMSTIHDKVEATFESVHGQDIANHLPGEYLKQTFGLEPFELDLLMVLALIQYHDKYARFWRYVSGTPEYAQINVSYLTMLFDYVDPDQFRRAFDENGALRRNALITLGVVPNWGNETPLAYSPVIVPNRLIAFLLGDQNQLLMPNTKLLSKPTRAHARLATIEKTLSHALQKTSTRLAILGYTGIGRTTTLSAVADKLGFHLLEVDLSLYLDTKPTPQEIRSFLTTLLREAQLQRAVLVFRCTNLSEDDQTWLKRNAALFNQILSSNKFVKLCVMLSRQTSLSRDVFGELTEIVFPQPSHEDQAQFWLKNLEFYLDQKTAANIAEDLAEGYCLSDAEIRTAIEQTLTRLAALSPKQALTAETLTDTLNKTRGTALEGLASLRSTTLKLSDIVLSPEIRQTLDEILAYARYRDTVMSDWGFAKYNLSGAGLSVLLSGLPGTGKTMTAQVLAHELKRALYVVDLSRVVDKYIGETEKRLAQIFDEAERSQAMLLFDEADSLFAKRTNVKSSNDRYANLEVNYLLQRLEAYSGVSILTTNFAGGLDEALARRIQFKIDFPMPDAKQRHDLWKRLIPPNAPLAKNVDFKALAEHFEMSGGHIKNAIFRASIKAAAEQAKIDHDMLWDAALNEFREMGHIVCDHIDEDDFY